MPHQRLVRRLLAWFAESARNLPWRRSRDPYAIWVSEIMLQQTQVKTVIPYWERWMRELPTIQALAQADSSQVHKLWEGLGYYTRVRNMQKAAGVIAKAHEGIFPDDFEKVLALPGIGRYTAGAICSIAFNQPHPVLDGNVMRVLTRVFGIEGNPRESQINARLWQLAEDLVRTAVLCDNRATIKEVFRSGQSALPGSNGFFTRRKPRSASNLNQALMELGAVVCTARQPRCEACPIASFCIALAQGRVDELPSPSRHNPATKRRFAAFVIERRKRFLVRQRPEGTVNAHLWEFPNIELFTKDHDVQKAAQREIRSLRIIGPLCSIQHTITRFRITLEVFRASFEGAKGEGRGASRVSTPSPSGPKGGSTPKDKPARWLTRAAMERLPFASAHRKILLKL